MILVNGSEQRYLDLLDRGFQYGDGLFETIAINNYHPVFLTEHLNRLKHGCSILKLPYPGDQILISELKALIRSDRYAVIKIILTRGQGGRGYRQPETINTTRVISVHPFPEYPETFKKTGIRARICDSRLGINPSLAGIKHLNRLEQVIARAEWHDDDIQEGLMFDINNDLVEGTMSNVFIVKEQQLLTPALINNGIKGIIRQIILDHAKRYNINVRCDKIDLAAVLDAEELFVTNSVIGLWPVAQLGNRQYQVGPMINQVLDLITECQHKDSENVL